MAKRSVLVTGAAGFIGSHLCEALLAAGHRVQGLDSLAAHYNRALKLLNLAGPLAHPDFTFHERDLLAPGLGGLVDGADIVFHLAARPGVRDSWVDFDDYAHSNVLGTKALLDACVGSVSKLVYASSSSVYGNAAELPAREAAPVAPISPYGATKVMTEVMAGAYQRAHGLDAVGLRYFTVYGPRQRPDMGLARFIDAAVAGRRLPIYGDGRQLRDFTYVGDVVSATVAAAERGRPGAIYNIASSNPRPLLDVLDALGEALGRQLDLEFEDNKIGDVRDTWGSTELAQADLEFAPATTLVEGLEAQVSEARRRREALAAA
ncbi:MAG TPA: NAD-dependent epimerase/dehydratase family protein [Solirubrobacteraceae bacterium]|nr:NAD-dependent epimerase/dehydratase family protein [Solirubrobacteraceae bacterium]